MTAQGEKGDKGDTGRTGFFINDSDQLKTALKVDNAHLILMNDLWVYEELDVTGDTILDLNGHTIYSSGIWNDAQNNWSVLSVKGGSLVLKGEGTIQTDSNDCFAVDVRNGGNLVIENGHYVGNISAVYAYNGNVTINGGTFEIQQLSEKFNDYRYLLNCHDEDYRKSEANFTVNGGKFYGFNPADNLAENFATGESFIGENREAIVYEEYSDYNVYKVVDPTDTTIEDYSLSNESIALAVKDGKLVEEYGYNRLYIERANGEKESIGFEDLDFDLTKYKTPNTPFTATATYEGLTITLKVLPIENPALLDTNNYDLNAYLSGRTSNFVCELNGEPIIDGAYLDYSIYSYEDSCNYNYEALVTADMLLDFDNTVEGMKTYTLDPAKVGCDVYGNLEILIYNPATAQISYQAYASFKVGEGSYDKITASKNIRVNENEYGYYEVEFNQEWLEEEIDFNVAGQYSHYSAELQYSITIYDPEVCNISNINFNKSFSDLSINKGATSQEQEQFLSSAILAGMQGNTTGTIFRRGHKSIY